MRRSWRHNPNPGSAENRFKEEHYRRLAYVNQHFAAGAPGYRTDRGRIYILHGPPDEREQHPGIGDGSIPASAPLNIRYPSDVWRYHNPKGIGKDVLFEFIDNCRCGEYQLQEDPTNNRGRSATGKQKFSPARRVVPASYRKWLDEDVRWIISDDERGEFRKLTTDRQRDDFVEAFWQRRNPNPGSSNNTFREEHYRRLSYANSHFGTTEILGCRTHQGRFYISYGPPDEIEHFPRSEHWDEDYGPGWFDWEVWHYRFIEGLGKDASIEFVDTCACGEYHLPRDPFEKAPPTKRE
jgi:GWxTD domain-containing protein